MSIETAGYRFSHQPSSTPSPLGGLRPFESNRTPIEFRALSAPQVFNDNAHLIHTGIAQGLGSVVEGVKSAFVSDRETKAALAKEQRDHERALQLEGIKTSRSKQLNEARLEAMRQRALERIHLTGGDKTPMKYVDDVGGDWDEDASEDGYYGENTPSEPYVDETPTGEQAGEEVYPNRIEPALPTEETDYNRERELNDENTVPTEDQNVPVDQKTEEDILNFEPLPDLSQQAQPFSGPSLLSAMDLSAIDPRYLSAQAGGAGVPPAPDIPLGDKLAPLDMSLAETPVTIDFIPPAAQQELRKQQQSARLAATRAAVQKEAAALADMQGPILAARAEPVPTDTPKAPKQKGFHPDFRAGAYRSLNNAQAAADLPVPEGYLPPTVELKRNKNNEEYYEVGVPQRATKAKETAGYDSEAEKKLRTEYINLDQSKEYRTVQGAYRNIVSSEKMSRSGAPAAGDMSLIFSFMKLLDPNSVVRETEYANAAKAAGMPDRIVASIARVVSGDILAPDQRKEFVKVAKSIFKQREESQGFLADQYKTLAKESGLRPEAVVIDLKTPDEEGDLQDEYNRIARTIVGLDRASQEYKDGLNRLVEIRERQKKLEQAQ